MVTRPFPFRRARGQRGAFATECVVALGIFALAAMPLSLAFLREARYSRACYQRAATMEIVDGEMEILAAGEWRSFGPGTHPYPSLASAATNLPAGGFQLNVVPAGESTQLRLAWAPAGSRTNGAVVRERIVR